jgi:hypothetical protein
MTKIWKSCVLNRFRLIAGPSVIRSVETGEKSKHSALSSDTDARTRKRTRYGTHSRTKAVVLRSKEHNETTTAGWRIGIQVLFRYISY